MEDGFCVLGGEFLSLFDSLNVGLSAHLSFHIPPSAP